APTPPLFPYTTLFRSFPRAPVRPIGGGTDILIAGCGTGSHPIETYRRLVGARMLAIDLSRTSLAYAVRKTRALGLPIEYAQADRSEEHTSELQSPCNL